MMSSRNKSLAQLYRTGKKTFKLGLFSLSYSVGFPFTPPRVLQLSLTNRCNLACKMCLVKRYATTPDEEMKAEEIIRLIETAKRQFDIEQIIITGGEPLLLEGVILKAIECARSHGIGVILTTNGFSLARSARALVDAGVTHFHVSLDGLRDTHNFLRGDSGAFDTAVSGISALSKIKYQEPSSYSIGLGTLILKNNIDELYELYLLGDSLRVDVFDLLVYLPDNTNFSGDDITPFWPDADDMDRFREVYERIRAVRTERIRLNEFFDFELVMKYYTRRLKRRDWRCYAGFKNFFVTMSDPYNRGVFEPCLFLCKAHIPLKDFDFDLKRMWHSKAARQARKAIRHCKAYCYQMCFSLPSVPVFLRKSMRPQK